MTDKEKITKYLEFKGVSKNKFYQKTGFSVGFLDSGSSLGVDKLKIIIDNYHDFNAYWLLNDDAPMILPDKTVEYVQKNVSIIPNDYIPLYNAPVVAGNNGISFDENGVIGHLAIPGVTAIAYFTVSGCSMEPTIRNGDIIGIDTVNKWEELDPDKIYYIITYEDRMIKHLRFDKSRPDELICISPNFKEFYIDMSSIKAIYKVVFYARFP